jgi:hypothetical protein
MAKFLFCCVFQQRGLNPPKNENFYQCLALAIVPFLPLVSTALQLAFKLRQKVKGGGRG